MRKRILALVMAAVLTFAGSGIMSIDANAADVTVSGTVESGSNDKFIQFKTSDGTMTLEIDSNSDLSKCKVFLPGKQMTLKITYGNDAYWHIKEVTAATVKTELKVDKSNPSTVTGKVMDNTTEEVLYFETTSGEMHVKLDADTDFSGCTALIPGNYYTLKLGYGSDAYMHVLSVQDSTSGKSSSSTASTAYASGFTQAAPDTSSNVKAEATVTGTIGDNSTASIMYLDTNDGVMSIKLDQYNGPLKILVAGQKVTVGVNYGDEYWHAVSIVNK